MADEPIFGRAPGEKNEDNRSRLSIFFSIFFTKFWKLTTINLMFLLFNIPAVIVSLVLSFYMVILFMPEVSQTFGNEFITTMFISGFPTAIFFMAIPLITVGPAQAGMTYLLRCYTYERPTFNWSDFKEKMKENMKQGILVSLINLFILVFLIFDLYLYPQVASGGLFFSIANGLIIVVFLLFLMASLYIYPMMVTYKLRIRDLYKNAILFSLARFVPNLAILILCFLVIIGPTFLVSLTASVFVLTLVYVFYFAFGFTLPGLIVNFMVNPVMDKYLKPKE